MSTLERLKEIYLDANGKPLVSTHGHLVEDLGLDSLDTCELLMRAEDEFGVMLDDEVLEKIVTVQDAVDAIDAALEAKGVPA